ncbi:MAG: tetratricopeptide repeat protein [Saprospiraceae bacterium]
MKNHDEQLIEQYFAKSLDAEGQALLQSRLEADPELRTEFEWQKNVAEGIKLKEDRRIKALLQKEEARMKPAEQPRLSYRRLSSIAATLALLAAAIWFVLPHSGSSDLPFSPYPDTFIFRDEVAPVVNQATDAYKSGAYQEAAKYFATAAEQEPGNPNYTLYQAISLIGSEKYEQAISILSPLAEISDNDRIPHVAQWYLAFAYYKTGKNDQAIRFAEQYLENQQESSFKKEAKQMLDLINKK